MRNKVVLWIIAVPLIAAAQVRPPIQDPRTPTRVPINLQSQRVRLLAASEPSGSAVDVKLRWVINEGWVPPGGFRLYRVAVGKKTRVYPPATASTAKLSPQVTALRQSAVLPFSGDSKLFAETLTRPPSSASVFQARSTKAKELIKKPQMNGRILKESLITLPPVSSFFNNLKAPPTGPRMQTLAKPGEKVLDARRALIFSALASPASADVLGFGATDKGLPAGTTVGYELYEVGSDGRDAANPVASISGFRAGADPMPTPPTNVLATQIGEGEVELRWDRLNEADETKAGLALYDIRRFTGTQGITPVQPALGRTVTTPGTVLTPQPIVIADLKTTTGFVEPFSFFADKAAEPGRNTYSVVLVDGFGRRSAPATVVIDVEDLRVPSAPSPIAVELTGGGRNMIRVREAPNQPPIKVTWNANSDDNVRYFIYRKDTETTAAPVKLTPNPISGTPVGTRVRRTAKGSVTTPTRSYTDSTAEPDRKYQYILRSTYTFNPLHESSDAPTAVIDVPSFAKPGIPSGFKVDAFKPTGAKNAELKSYSLSSGTFKGVDLTFGNPISPVRPPTGPTLPTGAGQINLPKALKPAVEIGGSFVVRWNAMPNMREPLYRVVRQVKGQPATSIEAGTSKTTSFTDNLPRSQKVTYEYTVLCQSRWGVKGTKAAVVEVVAPATLPPASPAVVSVAPTASGDGITVILQPNAEEDDIQTYRVYRKTLARAQPLRPTMGKVDRFRRTVNAPLPLTPAQDPANDTGYELAGQINPGAVLSLVDTAAKDATKKYFYKVEAVNRLNMRSERSEPIGAEVLKMSIPAPANLSATGVADGINLSWQAVAGAKSYVVKRAPASGGEFTQVSAVLTTTSYSDKTAVRGRRYRYVVVALDVFGNVSLPSPETAPVKYPG